MPKSTKPSKKSDLLRIVVDTNVFVSGLINDTGAAAKLIDLLFSRFFDIVVSTEIVEEYEMVLFYLDKIPLANSKKLINYIKQAAIWAEPKEKPQICREEADDAFLACANAGGARYLITKNIGHFPKKYKQVETLRISSFLKKIGY